jgi:type I restriction enzyme M protein
LTFSATVDEDEVAAYKFAKGSHSDLLVLKQEDLTRIFKQAHNSLWGGGELNPSDAFDELDKLIFCKVWDERKTKKGKPYQFQIFQKETDTKINQDLFERINKLYLSGREKDPEVFKEDIKLTPEKLHTVVKYLEKVNLNKTDLDSKGRAFETFLGSFFRGDFGQFFTPRPIVKFVVDVLPIKNDSFVLDTSCGSGGFLLHALDKIRKQANEVYPNYLTDVEEAKEHHNFWHDFAEYQLYGIEINNQIARTAKMNMIIHDDGHTNVIAADGLLPPDDFVNEKNEALTQGLVSRSGNKGFNYNHFNFIITNPPFGSSIKQTEQAYMHQYGYAQKDIDWLNPKSKKTNRDNQSTEILFIEQCHKFLTEGGYLAIVVPDGILTNSSLQYVRDGLEEKFRIVAVISMPQTAFQATGAGVKSSVMFLKKHTAQMTETIQHQKIGLQDKLKEQNQYLEHLQALDKQKKQQIKELIGFDNTEKLQGKALTDSENFKEWKKQLNAEYKDKIESIKETLAEQYTEQKQQFLDDYPIFMAIAEDIGYDATGKPTNNNELDQIGSELERFIEAIEKGEA